MPTPTVLPAEVLKAKKEVLSMLPNATLARPFLFRFDDTSNSWHMACSYEFLGHQNDDRIFRACHPDLKFIKNEIQKNIKLP